MKLYDKKPKLTNKEITENNKKHIENLILKLGNLSEKEYLEYLNQLTVIRSFGFSYHNCRLIHAQNGSWVMGYNQWKEKFNRQVKGKAIWILAPRFKKNEKEDKTNLIGFVSVPVFDISVTEGDDEIIKNYIKERRENRFTIASKVSLESLIKTAEKIGLTVEFKVLGPDMGGYVFKNHIVINSLLGEIENTGTMVHEICHYLLGHTEIKNKTSKRIKEHEAETATYLICQELGIERKSEIYLKNWSLDAKHISKEFDKISAAAEKLYNVFCDIVGEVE